MKKLEDRLRGAWTKCRYEGISVMASFSAVPPKDSAKAALSNLADLIAESRRTREALDFIPPGVRDMVMFAANRHIHEGWSATPS